MTSSILERIELIFQVAISKALKIYLLSYYRVNPVKSLVLNQTALFIRCQLFLALVFITPIFIKSGRFIFFSRQLEISEVKNYPTDEKRNIYSTFDTKDQSNQGLPIDPFDLMNRLKQIGSMNNATAPTDALDEALNAFDQSQSENASTDSTKESK